MVDYSSHQNPFQVEPALANRLAAAKEAIWFRIGVMQSAMNDRERALEAFERVLAVNPSNVKAMTQAGAVLAKKECYPQAVAYLQRAINADSKCGEAWAVLAHCYVMTDDLQKAYQAYQSALLHLPNPKDPNLWYGIGLLYDRYGSLENALEAFLAVLSISPDFERADEVCFCIGIIYKEQQNFDEALKYFNKVVVAANPPPPLTRADGWYQIGHVNELKRDIPVALQMYKHALAENPKHPKTLQNYGWLEHQHNNNSTEAIRLLKLSSELDPSDGQTWYLLGRVHMALREFRQAYDAYQQAVYRDGRNATFWCSIGVLYYQMNQYRDAMDAYSRAIRLNPYVSEVWYDLGTLYESCGQNGDAIDAYRRAAELAPENTQINARLVVLENSMNPVGPPQQPQQPPHSAPQPQQLPVQHMQPDLHHPSQGHAQQALNPVLSRAIAPPLSQPTQSLGPHKLPSQSTLQPSHLQPPPQQMQLSAPVTQAGSNHIANTLQQRSGHMDISPIHGVMSQPVGHHRRISHDGRLPSPPSGTQASPPQGSNHLSSMMHQPLYSQQHSPMIPSAGNGVSQSESVNSFRQRSAPFHGAHLPSNHQGTRDQSLRPNSELPHISSSQQSQQQQTHLPQLSLPSQQQHIHQNQQATQNPSDQQHLFHGPQTQNHTSHTRPHEPQSNQAAQSQHTPLQSQQHSPPSQGHGQPPIHSTSDVLPHLQTLPQLQVIPQMQHDPEHQKRQESQQQTTSGPLEHHRQSQDQENDRAQYMSPQGDARRRQGFDQPNERHEQGLPKVPKAEIKEVSPYKTVSNDGIAGSQSLYTPNQNTLHLIPSTRNRIPALREPNMESSGTQGPPRSMSMHEITRSEPRGSPRRLEENSRDERDQGDRSRQESHPQSPHPPMDKPVMPDRLPAMNSLPGLPQPKDVNREVREGARLITPVATPSLAIPPSREIASMSSNDVQKSGSSPVGAPTTSGAALTIGTSQAFPPLSNRNHSSLGSGMQEGNDAPSALVGASTLTRFVPTPSTPTANSMAPTSLPSPLSVRKSSGGTVFHPSRSPRVSKPSTAPSLKSVPVPPTSSGQIESVPSPSSFPVLPALSTHPSTNEEKPSSQEGSGDHDRTRDGAEPGSVSRMSVPKADERGGKDSSGTARSEDGMTGRASFGILRSAPAPVAAHRMDVERQEKEDFAKSTGSAGIRHDPDNDGAFKRDGSSPKEELGRSSKRPRLHDLSEGSGSKSYGYDTDEKPKKVAIRCDSDRNDDEGRKGGMMGAVKSDIPSYKEIKADMRISSTGYNVDADTAQKRDGVARTNETDGGKSLTMGGQVIDLPRLSTPMSKLGGPPPLSGNTPLPSFRSERMNLTTSRGGSGSISAGKSNSLDNPSRSLPFPLRSAPVSSLSAPLKTHAPSPDRGVVDIGDCSKSRGIEEGGTSRVGEDKGETSPMRSGSTRDNVIADRITTGDPQKGSNGSMNHGSRGQSELNGKEEKQSGRGEIHTPVT